MKRLWLIALLFSGPVYGNPVSPAWTTGSSNQTENTTQSITRSIVTEKYGSALKTWEASNVAVTSSASGGIAHADAIFTPKVDTADWSLSITTRAASQLVEKITQTDAITTTSVISSLSVFSQ
tara:strand:+ start:271 stop:639 length:369 start_codon:yes stop_codon:yes gene_type:complete